MGDVHRVGPFILGKTLGTGSTGKVKLAFHVDTGFKVAIKIIDKGYLQERPEMGKKLEREIAVMRLINHPNVLQLFDVYETENHLFLILEHSPGGELFDLLVRKGALEQDEALSFFQQIIEGMYYCHKMLVCHRDLKPENLLLDADCKIKIADFGMASLKRREELLGTSCGSPHYASPEVVMGTKYDGMKADTWSCGVILYALVTGKLPFDDDNIRKLLAKVKAGIFSMPKFLNAELQDLITRMLTVDPESRMTLEEIREHPWYTSQPVEAGAVSAVDDIERLSKLTVEDMVDIDGSILTSLKALDFGDPEEVIRKVVSEEESLAKTYYFVLKERQDALDQRMRTAKRLGRVRSEYGMNPRHTISSISQTSARSSSNVTSPGTAVDDQGLQLRTNPGSANPKKRNKRRKSSAATALSLKRWISNPSESENEDASDLDESSSGSGTPRKSWLSSLFSDASKGSRTQTQFFTSASMDRCAKQTESALQDLNGTVNWNSTRTRCKSKHPIGDEKDGIKYIRIEVTITKIVESCQVIEFHRRSGDKEEFHGIVSSILATLLLRLGSVDPPVGKKKKAETPATERREKVREQSRKRAQFWRSSQSLPFRTRAETQGPPRQSTLARRVASAADEDPHPKPAARTRTETANAILTDRDESTPVGRTLSQ